MNLVSRNSFGPQNVDRGGDKGTFAASRLDDLVCDPKLIANDFTAATRQLERRLKIAEFNLLRAVSFAHSVWVRDAIASRDRSANIDVNVNRSEFTQWDESDKHIKKKDDRQPNYRFVRAYLQLHEGQTLTVSGEMPPSK